MEQKINSHRLGMVVGSLAGLWHLVWVVLVATGGASILMDFVFRLHFVEPPYAVMEFELGSAILLVALTAIVGYVAGWVLGAIWNRVYKA
ncbi:MAG: hypothetical protein AAB389_02390 [Patescibacteria group bacterium]